MNKTWRLNYDQYYEMSTDIAKKRTSVDQWAEMSLSGKMSKEELMCRFMMDNDPHYDPGKYICNSYVCGSYNMPEDFIKDLIYVNSGMALLGCWNDKVIDWVVDLHKRLITRGRSEGNAFNDVKMVLETGYFNDVPEYKHILECFMEHYYTLCNDLMEYYIPHSDDPKLIAKSVLSMADTSSRIINYNIEIRDRLDWTALETHNKLLYSFLEDHSKKVRFAPGFGIKSDDDIEDDALTDRVARSLIRGKYTPSKNGKNIKKSKEEVEV